MQTSSGMGYDREYRMRNGMWPKSSKHFADRLETKVLKLGLGIGASLLSSGSSSKFRSRYQRSVYASSYVPTDVSPDAPSIGASATKARIGCVILLILAIALQFFGYYLYAYEDWLAFFSLLVATTLSYLCIGFSFTAADQAIDMRDKERKGFFIATIIVAVLVLSLSIWPILVKDEDISFWTYVLLIILDVALIILSVSLCYTSSVQWKATEAPQEEVPTQQPTTKSKRTSRIVRIKDMEARFDKVKAALEEVKKAEEKLGDLSEDIDALREYYESGKWQKDFEADEQGKLPKDLKRGVLSEDGLGNLLDDVDDRI